MKDFQNFFLKIYSLSKCFKDTNFMKKIEKSLINTKLLKVYLISNFDLKVSESAKINENNIIYYHFVFFFKTRSCAEKRKGDFDANIYLCIYVTRVFILFLTSSSFRKFKGRYKNCCMALLCSSNSVMEKAAFCYQFSTISQPYFYSIASIFLNK
jgi:hypothetical protein